MAGVAVHRDRQVHLEVEAALGGRHESLFLGGHDDPLPLLPVADHVLLDGVGVVELAVALERVAHVVQAGEGLLDVGAEDARSGVIDPRAEQIARLDLVGVGQHVRGVGLRIADRGDAIGEVGEVLPDLGLVDSEGGPGMGVDVHESRNDGLAGSVDGLRRRRTGAPVRGRHADNAVVGHHDIALLDDLVALHADDPGARRAPRCLAARRAGRGWRYRAGPAHRPAPWPANRSGPWRRNRACRRGP